MDAVASGGWQPGPVTVPSTAVPRTYKLRRGRLGPVAADALTRLRPVLAVPVDGRPLDPRAVFGRSAPLVLEIGCGDGVATAALAAGQPEWDVLAVDVHTAGLAALLRRVEDDHLTNVRVAEGDALVVLRDMLAEGSLEEVHAWFPDPWPKARHAKRRLVQPSFAGLVASRLRPGGRLRLATDWTPYADAAVAALSTDARLCVRRVERPAWRPVTRFERRALAAGRAVVDLVAVRQ